MDDAQKYFCNNASAALNDAYNSHLANKDVSEYTFTVLANINYGINESKFNDSFVDKFTDNIDNDDIITTIASKYGLFCVKVINNNTSTKTLFVWLPKNSHTDSMSLPMKHDVMSIEAMNPQLIETNQSWGDKRVILYQTYSTIERSVHKIFKQNEYEALKIAIAEKITEELKSSRSTEPAGGGRYTSKTLKELQAIAKARKLHYSGLKKVDLIALLRKR